MSESNRFARRETRTQDQPQSEVDRPSPPMSLPPGVAQYYGVPVPASDPLPGGVAQHYGLIFRRAAVVSEPAGSPAQNFGAATSGAAAEVPHRAHMERAFGESFSGVRAYLGRSQAMASLGAEAATHGEQIAFGGQAPSIGLVAHELTHVVQQRRGGAGALQGKDGVSDPSCDAEREADLVADRVAAGERVDVQAAPASAVHLKRQGVVNDNADKCQGENGALGLPQGTYVEITDVNGANFVCRTGDGKQVLVPKEKVTEVADSSDGEVVLAKVLVANYLMKIGIGTLDGSFVDSLVSKVPVKFYKSGPWRSFVAKNSGGNADETEGLTTGDQRGQRNVGLNVDNYTTFAIVHELLHTLEHDSVAKGLPIFEGITELLTSRVVGFYDVRKSKSGGNVYEYEVMVVQEALANNAVTISDLLQAYFYGNFGPVQRAVTAWEDVAVSYLGSQSNKRWREEIRPAVVQFFKDGTKPGKS